MDGLKQRKKEILRIFGLCSDILNQARGFEEITYKMVLIAMNGAVNAAKFKSKDGATLIVLANHLSDIPVQIDPVFKRLQEQCHELSRNMTLCMVAVHRYMLIERCLQRSLGLDSAAEASGGASGSLGMVGLDEQVNKKIASGELSEPILSNSAFLLERIHQNITLISGALVSARDLIQNSKNSMSHILRFNILTRYTATCIDIQASHIKMGSDRFSHLVENVLQLVEQLDVRHEHLAESLLVTERQLRLVEKGGFA